MATLVKQNKNYYYYIIIIIIVDITILSYLLDVHFVRIVQKWKTSMRSQGVRGGDTSVPAPFITNIFTAHLFQRHHNTQHR